MAEQYEPGTLWKGKSPHTGADVILLWTENGWVGDPEAVGARVLGDLGQLRPLIVLDPEELGLTARVGALREVSEGNWSPHFVPTARRIIDAVADQLEAHAQPEPLAEPTEVGSVWFDRFEAPWTRVAHNPHDRVTGDCVWVFGKNHQTWAELVKNFGPLSPSPEPSDGAS